MEILFASDFHKKLGSAFIEVFFTILEMDEKFHILSSPPSSIFACWIFPGKFPSHHVGFSHRWYHFCSERMKYLTTLHFSNQIRQIQIDLAMFLFKVRLSRSVFLGKSIEGSVHMMLLMDWLSIWIWIRKLIAILLF